MAVMASAMVRRGGTLVERAVLPSRDDANPVRARRVDGCPRARRPLRRPMRPSRAHPAIPRLSVRDALGAAGSQRRRPRYGHAQRHARRRLSNPTKTAVVGLAGGPGQAAIPNVQSFARIAAAGLATRDLLVFDQRGTGASGRLRCAAFERPSISTVSTVNACAQELGAARGLYRTADSVDDLEALRVESGYDKLVLVGVSYGTKVALDYAAKYPTHVESMILDSMVPPEGSDPLNRTSLQAVGPPSARACRGGACPRITTTPLGDVSRLVRRMVKAPLHGTVNTPWTHGPGRAQPRRTVRHPPGRRPQPDAARRAAELGAQRAAQGQPAAAAAARARRGPDRAPPARRPRACAPRWASRAPATRPPTAARCSPPRAARRPSSRGIAPPARPPAPPRPSRPRARSPPPGRVHLPRGADQRGDPALRRLAGGLPRAGGAGPAARRADADPRRRLRRAHARRRRTVGRRPDPRQPARPGPLRRPLGARQRLLRRARRARSTPSSAAGRSTQCNPAQGRVFTPTGVAPTRLSKLPGRTKASKTVAAAAATVVDVRRQFIGDELAAGRSTRAGMPSPACARAQRWPPAPASACAASSSCPASPSRASSRATATAR